MDHKKLNNGSKDIISTLPEALIYHILSFLPTKESASTSLLSRNWRHLFAFVPNLDLDDPVHMQPDLVNQQETNEIHTTFIDFVDRVVSLQGNLPLNKFSLKCGINVDSVAVTRWIINVLDLGVSDLDLRVAVNYDDLFPSRIFVSKSLVRLKIGARNGLAFGSGLTIEVEDVFLPKLKTLYLDSVVLDYQKICLAKLLTGCHVLEDLFLVNLWWTFWESCSVSTLTLKRLTFSIENDWDSPTSVTFDTPALVYFDCTDTVALKYENMNFDSLTEAKLGLRVGYEEIENDMGFEGQQWEGLLEHAWYGW